MSEKKSEKVLKPIIQLCHDKNIWIFKSNLPILDRKGVPYEKQVKVKKSKIKGAGKGVFAMTNILPFVVIGVYKGHFLSEEEAIRLKNQTYLLRIHPGRYYIDAKDKSISNWTRYINDPYGPKRDKKWKKRRKHVKNVAFSPDGFIYTIRPIEKGEELLVDYGDDYWEQYLKVV